MVKCDLFIKKTMNQRVKEFCQEKGFTTSIDLENLKDRIRHTEGNIPGVMRIHREARDLVKTEYKNGVLITINPDGVLHRLSRKEKIFRGFDRRFATYEYIGEKKKRPIRWTNLPVTPMARI
jgi:hypothetical protein